MTRIRESDINQIYNPKRTGLHDKHGTELYEGVRFRYTEHSGYMLSSFNGVVVWMKEYACFGYRYEDFPMRVVPFAEHHELKRDFLDHIEIVV